MSPDPLLVDLPPETRELIETAEGNGHHRVGEPLVYTLEGRNSYIRDRALLAKGEGGKVAERLERHDRQIGSIPVETRSFANAEYESRVNPNLTAGTGGEFAPPYWWIEKFAKAPRPGRVLQRLMPTFDLPDGISSVNVPRMTVGTAAESPVAGVPSPDQDVETKTVKAEVATFVGLSDWALQALEQSPPGAHLDWAAFVDLTDAIESQVERELITGEGKNEKLQGMFKLTGANEITATEAKIEKIFPAIGKGIAQIGVKRQKPPEATMMNSSRLAWLATTGESEQRPLILTDKVGDEFPVASLSGVAVYLNDNIPNTLGAKAEEDTIIICRPQDMILLPAQEKVTVMLDVLSGTMTARFRAHKRVAAFTHRFPSAISFVTGKGLIPEAGFK